MFTIQTHAGRVGRWVHTPETWQEAADLMAEHSVDAAVSGGATYLMWRVAKGESMPDHLISLHRIKDHDEVLDGSVGALATLRRLERGPMAGAHRALTMAASVTAGPSIRTLATLGGNLASGFPNADLVPALLALDATVHLHGGRQVPATEVIEKGLGADDLITRITHDLAGQDGWSGATIKLSRRGMDLSVGTASVVLRTEGEEVTDARIAVSALFDRPARLTNIEHSLVGADTSEETIRELLEFVPVAGKRFLDDQEATSAYRRRIAGNLVRRAILLAARLGPEGTPTTGSARM